MKYFICSDIHGCYNQLISSLSSSGFDKGDENHTLVVLGDIFDRGKQNVEVYEFLTSIPQNRLVLVRGNHEDLLVDAVNQGKLTKNDISNGTNKTILQFIEADEHKLSLKDRIKNRHTKWYNIFKELPIWKFINDNTIWRNYFELGDYIMCHGWIPLTMDNHTGIFSLNENWRNCSSIAEWESARWQYPHNACSYPFNRLYPTDKIMVCGHCPTVKIREELFGEESDAVICDCSVFRRDNLVCIDGAAAFGGILNIVTIDDLDMVLRDCDGNEIPVYKDTYSNYWNIE